MTRLTLERGHWYAAEIIGDEFDLEKDSLRSYSPIKVHGVCPMQNRTYRLDFYHANYPAGVQNKSYKLRTIERGHRFILACSLEHDPRRYLLICDITPAWLRQHFHWITIRDEEDVAAWLDRNV